MLTVVIPYIDKDAHLMERAVASVTAQTIPTRVIPVHDKDRRNPQWARNTGLAQVKTPFVTFLDADDELLPTFAEMTLNAYRLNHYVYTDYYFGSDIKRLEDDNGRYPHGVVTRVIRTDTAKAVGGFDERLKRLEDTEFWLRVRARGICGVHVAEPLMIYNKGGQRSTSHQDREQLIKEIKELIGRYKMGCCGKPAQVDYAPKNEKFEGAVLATATWQGNRTVVGKYSGRKYPRTAYPKQIWVDRRDLTMPEFEAVIIHEQIAETPIIENTAIDEPQEETVKSDTIDLETLTKDEIKALLDETGTSYKSNATKAELIELYNEHLD